MMNNYFRYILAVILTALMSFNLVSCESDDNEEGGINASFIYGTWILSNEEGTEDGVHYSHPYKWTWYFRFNPDDTWFSYWEEEGSDWRLRGRGNLTIDTVNGTIEFDYKYQLLELTNKTLTVKETYQDGDYQTKTFTKVADSLLDDVLDSLK